jgi:hypothetical protein
MRYGDAAFEGGVTVDQGTVHKLIETVSGMIEDPNTGAGEYVLVFEAPYKMHVEQITHQLDSGTATIAIRRNNTDIGALDSIGVTTTKATTTATGANKVIRDGDRLSIVVTASSSAENLRYGIKISRGQKG